MVGWDNANKLYAEDIVEIIMVALRMKQCALWSEFVVVVATNP
jgi:hypothetical protein